jgi:hypothetical protein
MAVVKNKQTDQNREFWTHVERVSSEVDRQYPRPSNGSNGGRSGQGVPSKRDSESGSVSKR